MSEDENSREPLTVKRWSARKLAAAREARGAPAADVVPAVPQPSPAPAHPDAVAEATSLPPIESLTFDSDFAPFLKPEVDESLKRAALKKLLRDPRFNVMDGLDVYIDDYSKPDPIEPDVVKQLMQARYLFDPPKTRVNDEGVVEEVPPDVESPAQRAARAEPSGAIPAEGSADLAQPELPLEIPNADKPRLE